MICSDVLTIVSGEHNQTYTPSALASGQHIFPPSQAATDADKRRSWLSLCAAHIMSRYRSRSRLCVRVLTAPREAGVVGADSRRL